jgi:hypothetical protein
VFRIDVTFEMRTAAESKAFIQLIIKHTIKTSFIVETEKGGKGKTAERQRERERDQGRECKHWEMADVASVINRLLENTHVKINKMVSSWTD